MSLDHLARQIAGINKPQPPAVGIVTSRQLDKANVSVGGGTPVEVSNGIGAEVGARVEITRTGVRSIIRIL